MLEKATIARPYAEAAFSQALEEGALSDWSIFFGKLKLIVSDADMRGVINNPRLSDERLIGLIVEIFGKNISSSQRNLVTILIYARRILLVPEIARLFEQSKSAAESVSEVDVISAYALDNGQLDAISESIAQRLGKKVDIHASEDSSLIGGVVIRVGDTVIDASVKGRLKELNNLLRNSY